MNITVERATGHAFVVASDEVKALEEFGDGRTFDTEREALSEEDYRNGRGSDGAPELNTYKIVVTAEKVH